MEESRNYRTPDVRTFMQELGGTGSHTKRPISPTPRSDIRQETPFQTKVEEIKDAAAPKKKSRGKAKALIIFSVLLLLLAGGFAAPSLFDGCSDSDKHSQESSTAYQDSIATADSIAAAIAEYEQMQADSAHRADSLERERLSKQEKSQPKPNNSKKGNNKDNTVIIYKGNNVGSKIKSNKGESDITPTDIRKVATENDKENNVKGGRGDTEL